MAFSFLGTSPAVSSAGINALSGANLEEIQTETIGWLALAGESKVQLLPTSWPSDHLPPPTASLMSVASHKGLVAAAGPDLVILATTESVRKAFEGPPTGDGNVKLFQPQLKLPMPMRISQLTFTADESYLVLSAEVGGGLAVYDVQSLLQGSTLSAFELSTNGQALRALIPNPTAEKGELLALVTNDGNLMMANLKERKFNTGPNGQVLKSGVSCVSWSTKGKQLVAGLGNGTSYQMTPEGEGKADIPRPPNASMDDHVSSITWLENHVFLLVLTPSTFDTSNPPASTFYVVSRDAAAPTSFLFQKITDPIGNYGMNRSPPHHFLLRLRDFPPNLQDVLVVCSTASIDIGLFSRSKVPLTNAKSAEKVTGVFTMTEMLDDSHRASLPMTAELTDTTPIGLAFDLSSKEKVHKPIPSYEEISESPTPVPALMVLNNEGVLASWWFIYSDSIRQGTIYSGLVAASGAKPAASTPSALQPAPASAFGGLAKPAFGTSGFNSAGAGPGKSAFGASPFSGSTSTPAFGSPTAPGAFGGPSALGQSKSPWGTPAATSGSLGSAPGTNSAFGAPSFGQTSTPSMGLGNKISPWATGTTAPNAAFGQSGGLGKPVAPFGTPTPSNGQPVSSGFAAFATKGGFAAAPAASVSIFGSSSKPAENPFSKAGSGAFSSSSAGSSTLFGNTPAAPTGVFGNATANRPSGLGGPFVLGSTFKADPSAKGEDNEPTTNNKSSFFGGAFGGALSETAKQPSVPETNDADMDADDTLKPEPAKVGSTTPASTPAAPKTQFFPTSTPTSSGLFGLPSTSSGPPPAKPVSAGFNFGNSPSSAPKPGGFFANLNQSSTPAGPKTPTAATTLAINPFAVNTPLSQKIKEEPIPETPTLAKIPEAPLPPDPVSKATFTADSSNASSIMGVDAPLPPDFITQKTPKPEPVTSLPLPLPEKKLISADLVPPSDIPGVPEDGGDSSGFLTEDEEGSGEDVTKDLSPISEARPSPGFSPESSFGGPKTRSTESSLFGQKPKPGGPTTQPLKSLFGEIGTSAPVLHPPKIQQSPRSPSPIRSAIPPRMSRPDTSRSVSAPGAASNLLGSQRAGGRMAPPSSPTPNNFHVSLEHRQAEEQRRTELRAKKEEEETRALDDEEDDRIQQFLASDIEPTKVLDEFEVYTLKYNNEPAESIPSQVELVYRDINAMIDTLGLNVRKLKCFIQAHTDQYKEEGRSRSDLEDDDEWCLVEIQDLSVIVERELTKELEDGRVIDIAGKLQSCASLQKDLARLRAKHEDMRKIFDGLRDPEQLMNARAQPLSAEQLAQQNDLRRDFTTFQKLLCEAEEGLSVLKAKIVSQSASNGKVSGTGPTMEAVMRTIKKMTTMAEKRSGDIDVLENQMRKLRFGSTGSVGSREGSPFTPQRTNRTSVRTPVISGYGLFYTPDSAKETPQNFGSSMISSTGSLGKNLSPRKKMSGYTPEEKVALRAKLARRKEVTDKLKFALAKNGIHVRTMGEE